MKSKQLTILYHIPYPSSTGADRWIYEGWREAFLDLGHQFYELTAFDDLKNKANSIKPDIFMTAVNLIRFDEDYKTLSQMRKQGTKIYMWIHWPLLPAWEKAKQYLLQDNIVDIFFGERERDYRIADFELKSGHSYHVIPNAANKKWHYPTHTNQKYRYDLVYLGAKLPKKRWFLENVLKPLSKKYRVGIFGPYWTMKDHTLRTLVKTGKFLRFKKWVDYFNKLRIVLPAEEENSLYSSAKISLNFHEREPDGSQPHYIVNQRTFKIPACGGFQLCDYVPAINQYFSQDEIIMAHLSTKEWHDVIEHYINDEQVREKIRHNGTSKALLHHTYHNRVDQVLTLYEESL